MIWCTVPEIQSETEFFLSFWAILSFYHFGLQWPEKSKFWKNKKKLLQIYHFTYVYHKWQSCDVWFLRDGALQMESFVIFGHFLPFYPPNNPENQNFENREKTPGYIIILNICTINDNHMMYGSWYMEHNRQNFLSFLHHFLPFYPHNNPENQNFEIMKKKKTSQHIIILQISTIITIMWCMVPEIWCVTDEIFCYFRPFSALLPP